MILVFGGSSRRNALLKNAQNMVVLGPTECFAAVWPRVVQAPAKKTTNDFSSSKTPENSTKKTENRSDTRKGA